MKTKGFKGGRGLAAVTLRICALGLCLVGCTSRGPQTAMLDDMEDMQLRVRLLQSEVSALRQTLSERDEQIVRTRTTEATVEQQLSLMQSSLDALPEQLASLCPKPGPAALTTKCEPRPDAQRVMVSGDKLVVGEVERVWLDPPGTFLEARINANSEISSLRASEIVEFERDGNRWVRFQVAADGGPVIVERKLTRFTKGTSPEGGNGKRPVVTLRVQVGDVRESIEVTLAALPDQAEAMVLGRNFLTDVALVDVARKHVQPAFRAPD